MYLLVSNSATMKILWCDAGLSLDMAPDGGSPQVMEAIVGDVGKEGKGSDKVFKHHFSKCLATVEIRS